MPRKLRDCEEGAFHHVYARGNRKEDVFRDDEDRRWFLERLLRVEGETGTLHMAHCLMSNHVHILFRPGPIGISRILQRILGGYSQWFNLRHGQVGHVFQGRFGSRVIDSDEDLLWILRYIHRNPVEAGMVPRPELWKWSTHADYLRRDPPHHLREGVHRARLLLSEDADRALLLYRRLVERTDDDCLHALPGDCGASPDVPPSEQAGIPLRPSLDEIALRTESLTSIGRDVLKGRGTTKPIRNARRAFCRSARWEWGYSLVETAAYLGRSAPQVSDLSRDPKVARKLRSQESEGV